MNIKDIVNRDLVNLTNCESEPIHIPGSIQPHGFLMALRKKDLLIDFCTGNSEEFSGKKHTELLGKSFAAAFGGNEEKRLKEYIENPATESSKPLVLSFQETGYNCLIYHSNDYIILDLEPFPDGSLTLPDLYSQTKRFVSHLERSVSLQDLCQIIAAETRLITGYDRVMIYRFDKDYNGEVFAESKREDLESFLGLHYPHTDIPVQARELYMRNLMRIIVDVSYKPVPIYTIDDKPGKNLDLSDSVLRSVSPIHIEYLHNIGVGATLTISLIHNKRLWGLIACHHYSSKNLPHYTRLAAQLQGHFLTSQINVRELAENYDLSQIINRSLENLLVNISEVLSGNFQKLFNPDLLRLANSTGFALLAEGKIFTYGKTPEENYIRILVEWLSQHSTNGLYLSSKLIKDFPGAEKISETASGLLYYSLGTLENDCIVWFRQEVKKTVNWAGDPNKAIIKNEKGLSPRKSFELWKEITRFQSEEWRDIEIDACTKFGHSLQRQMYLLYLTKEESKYRLLSEKLQKANAELENINWISHHDLKEPIRKIQMFASRILEDDKTFLPAETLNSVERMSDFADRMQHLLTDLMAYASLKDLTAAFTLTDLNDLLSDIKKDLKEEIEEAGAIISGTDLPCLQLISFQVRQLFINLIRNSIKFSKENTPPKINIRHSRKKSHEVPLQDASGYYHCITLSDNGIGFDNEYATSMFNVFKRLHSSKKHKGTGIGLAICKKIMENHDGAITASGQVDKGACFYLYFPERTSAHVQN